MVNAGWPTKADRCSKHIDHPRKLLFAGHSVRHWSLEGFRTHRGIAHRVSDLGVAQVTLKPPRIHASASQGIACAVAQHVDMHREAVFGVTGPLDHPVMPMRLNRLAALIDEHIRRLGLLFAM